MPKTFIPREIKVLAMFETLLCKRIIIIYGNKRITEFVQSFQLI